jgi:hypothetical protein
MVWLSARALQLAYLRGDVQMPSFLLIDGTIWLHVAALIAVAIGLVDLWWFRPLQHDPDVALMLGGLGALGLNTAFNPGRAQVQHR